ncbi:unnamed protein product [Spirodela intermedia]|uniref:Uncharacterized protein n=1 Tax=Spirodela intermedia TaxID=51605 RepID=A0A7I8JB61_SPIIN|nr:unnamed protein product [Spirodela intermedia]CAA6667319.1 unnamed protein product [Spirodela intermedia]
MIRERPRRRLEESWTVWRSACWRNASSASTSRLRLLTGGKYSISGAAEKATAKNSCNIILSTSLSLSLSLSLPSM